MNTKSVHPKIVFEHPLSALINNEGVIVVDLSSKAIAPSRYRLLDCAKFTQDNVLSIVEIESLPLADLSYSAISYVWRGNPAVESDSAHPNQIIVKGAEDADPINVSVLHHACQASLLRGLHYIWMDRLCIKQTDRADKNWQIKQMHHVYRSCGFCIVLPGGVQRLVRLDEDTSWIHRGWTLQEALAPPSTSVLFSWKLGPGKASAGDDVNKEIEEVSASESAMAPLSLILNACVTGSMSFRRLASFQSLMIEAKIFSAQPTNYSYNDVPFWRPQRKLFSPNVAALAVLTSNEMDADAKAYATWQSALMRTSSRSVDMVFSIMGLFDVTLDTAAFHQDDRIGATIALAREILDRGGRAHWLGASFRLAPCRELSTFPVFPRTRVAGKALIRVENTLQEVSEYMDAVYPYSEALIPMPQGRMDKQGYLTFTGKAVEVLPVLDGNDCAQPNENVESSVFAALDGTKWKARPAFGETSAIAGTLDGAEGPRSFAILLGWFNEYYPGATPSHDTNNIRTMLVQESAYGTGKFHVKGYCTFSRRLRSWVKEWKEHIFSVGGPEEWRGFNATESRGDTDEDLPEITVVKKLTLPTSKEVPSVTLADRATRAARWATEQRVLEKSYGLSSTAPGS